MPRVAIPALAGLLLAAACSRSAPNDVRDRLGGASLPTRLAAADPARGADLFHACAACHSIARGTGDRDGPNLWGVVGAPIGHNSSRYGYTAALQQVGGVWTTARLDRWLTSPQAFAPGTKMMFPGLQNGMDRADVIAFLARNGPSPANRR